MCNAFFSSTVWRIQLSFWSFTWISSYLYQQRARHKKYPENFYTFLFNATHWHQRQKTLEHIPTPTLTTSQLQKQIVLFYLHILTSLTMLLKVLSYLYVITTAWCLQHHLFHYQRFICHFFRAHGHRKRRRHGRICVGGRWTHKTTV